MSNPDWILQEKKIIVVTTELVDSQTVGVMIIYFVLVFTQPSDNKYFSSNVTAKTGCYPKETTVSFLAQCKYCKYFAINIDGNVNQTENAR